MRYTETSVTGWAYKHSDFAQLDPPGGKIYGAKLPFFELIWMEHFMATVNFTGAVDRDLLKRAKIIAAKTDTSVNALFNAELRYLVETFEAAEVSSIQNFRALLDFSLGRINDLEVKQLLGIESDEDLFLLMSQAHLPMPRLSAAITQSMVESLEMLST